VQKENKLILLTSHPIQYNAPFFSALSNSAFFDVHVLYTSAFESSYDSGFNMNIKWDINLLNGYSFSFLKDTKKSWGRTSLQNIRVVSLVRTIKKEKPDIIIIYGWNFISHLFVLFFLKKKFKILFRGDSTVQSGKSKLYFRKLFLKIIYRRVDCFLYTGSANLNYYRWIGIAEKKILFLPHSIDNNRFSKVPISEVCELKKELKLQNGTFVYMYAGKLTENKNVAFLIDCFKELKDNSSLLIVGDGSEMHSLKMISVENNVYFTGFINQSEIPKYYHLADCIINPSFSETWGLTINELIAADKPVIVREACGCA